MKKIKTFLITTLLLSCAVHSYGQSETNSIDLIKSEDFGKRKQAVELVNQQRNHIIESLIVILNGNSSEGVKESAAKILGDYRATEAVNALAQNVWLDIRPRTMLGILSEEDIHPITTAFEKIGAPSIPVVIQILEEKGNALEKGKTLEEMNGVQIRLLLLRTLYRIEGDKDIVQLRLQKALTDEKDSQKQERLQAALKSLAEIQFGK